MGQLECRITVNLLLKKENKILLMKRQNTGFEDGMYELTGGHVERNESLKGAMIREAKEEIGIDLKKEDLKFLIVIYKNSDKNYVNFFFLCETFEGEIQNCEPNKCSDIGWFELDNLPEDLGGIARRVIDDYKNGTILDEFGWED